MNHQIFKSRFTQLILFMLFAFNAGISQIQIGPKAGMTFFKQKLTDIYAKDYNSTLISGYSLGAGLEYNTNGKISLGLDILYNQRGGFFKSKKAVENIIIDDGATYTIEAIREFQDRLNYLNVPLVAKYNFRGKTFALNLQGGIELGILLNAERTKQLISNPSNANDLFYLDNQDLFIGSGDNDTYLKSDFAVVLGTGFFYQLDSGKLTFDLRYSSGVNNISRVGERSSIQEQKNSGYSILLGYMFPFGGGY